MSRVINIDFQSKQVGAIFQDGACVKFTRKQNDILNFIPVYLRAMQGEDFSKTFAKSIVDNLARMADRTAANYLWFMKFEVANKLNSAIVKTSESGYGSSHQ